MITCKRMQSLRWALYGWLCLSALNAQNKIVWTEQEKPIVEKLGRLRSMPDDLRPDQTRQLAIQIRQLPASGRKAVLAEQLANLATEGDPGQAVLQEVATTLAQRL